MGHLFPDFCAWLQNTRWAVSLLESTWAYPFVQLLHFAGLSLWTGTSVALDLRLAGARRKRGATAQLSDGLFVWNWIGFGLALTGGFMLFATAASAFVYNAAFLLKVGILLPVLLVTHVIIQRKVRSWEKAEETPLVARIAGLVEILLWLAIVSAAASIPLYQK